jgi:GNAT superfamily N-acetyltransferase
MESRMITGATLLNLDGYSDVPPGKIAAVVTHLEMRAAPPAARNGDVHAQLSLERIDGAAVARYLSIYRALGERWMWFSRLAIAPAKLGRILADPDVEAFVVQRDGRDCGLLELDRRVDGECEIVFLGLLESEIGQGAGRWLMNRALKLAWRPGVERVWLHTCSFDHPGALAFYRSSGFVPCKVQIEICDDPRLNGVMRRDAAPHVPLIEA